jgi:hypothetical protein
MIIRLIGAVFAPKYPRFYAGRHRARIWGRVARPVELAEPSTPV